MLTAELYGEPIDILVVADGEPGEVAVRLALAQYRIVVVLGGWPALNRVMRASAFARTRGGASSAAVLAWGGGDRLLLSPVGDEASDRESHLRAFLVLYTADVGLRLRPRPVAPGPWPGYDLVWPRAVLRSATYYAMLPRDARAHGLRTGGAFKRVFQVGRVGYAEPRHPTMLMESDHGALRALAADICAREVADATEGWLVVAPMYVLFALVQWLLAQVRPAAAAQRTVDLFQAAHVAVPIGFMHLTTTVYRMLPLRHLLDA